jgi:hypothetical protein
MLATYPSSYRTAVPLQTAICARQSFTTVGLEIERLNAHPHLWVIDEKMYVAVQRLKLYYNSQNEKGYPHVEATFLFAYRETEVGLPHYQFAFMSAMEGSDGAGAQDLARGDRSPGA